VDIQCDCDELELEYCQYYSVEVTLPTVIAMLTNVLSVRMSNPKAWDDVGYRGIMWTMWDEI